MASMRAHHLAALVISSMALPSLAAQGPRPSPDGIARAVDSLARRALDLGLGPALGVAVVMDGRTIYAKSHGWADATARVAANDRTLWYLASTSKSFTGFAVSLLAQRGAISFDTPVADLVPTARWAPEARPQELTLARFLSHTHHLSDDAVVTSAAFTGAIPESRWPELLAWAVPTGSTDLVYSNLGYNVAAMVIDAREPTGWRAFLEREVFAPAGIREIYHRISDVDRRRIALPHDLKPDGSYRTARFAKTDATMNSAGGHLATVADAARWVIVQMDGGVIDGRRVFPAEAVALSHRILAEQTRPQARTFAYFNRVGWSAGWDVGDYQGEPMVSRFGGYHTTRSHLSFLPGRRIGVVADATAGPAGPVTDLIAAMVYDLEAGRPGAESLAHQRLADLAGRLEQARQRIAAADSVRRTRQQGLGRPVTDFVGSYFHPAFGTFEIRSEAAGLSFRWGVLDGPVEVFDAARHQLRFEMAGTGTVAAFELGDQGPAQAVTINGARLARRVP